MANLALNIQMISIIQKNFSQIKTKNTHKYIKCKFHNVSKILSHLKMFNIKIQR